MLNPLCLMKKVSVDHIISTLALKKNVITFRNRFRVGDICLLSHKICNVEGVEHLRSFKHWIVAANRVIQLLTGKNTLVKTIIRLQ